jgi:hypothetical protein
LCIIEVRECSVRNFLVPRRTSYLEVVITTIEPQEWVARAIILGKLKLVDRQKV